MFLACKTYDKQLTIEKTGLSHQVWSHGGSTFKKKRTLNVHFSRPAETDPYGGVKCLSSYFGQERAFSAIFFCRISKSSEWMSVRSQKPSHKSEKHTQNKNGIFFILSGPASNGEFPKWASQDREFSKWASAIQVLLAGLFQEFLLWASPFRELLIWACPFREFLFWASSFQEFLIWCRPPQIFSLYRSYSSKKLVQNVHNLCEIGA